MAAAAHTGTLELLRQTIRAAPRPAEHDRGTRRRNELGGDSRALRSIDPPEHVVSTAAVGLGSAGVVTHRVALVVAGEHLDRAVERRREQHRLAARRRLVEQAPNLGKESHVGHAVGFVDHHDLDLLEVERVLAQQVGETARACDENVDAAVELAPLVVVSDTAVDGTHAELARRCERLELATDLPR